MRIAAVALALLAGLTSAHASIGFSCNAEDKSVTLAASGAYGTSIGSGLNNFGADLAIKLAGAPDDVRKLTLDQSHIAQAWFLYRDLKLMTRWEAPEGIPFREIILTIETRRGKDEGAPYRGRYTLSIAASPSINGSDGFRLETGGPVSCNVD